MVRDSDKYRSILSPEISLIGELLSPAFDIHTFQVDKVLSHYDPERLLSLSLMLHIDMFEKKFNY